MISLQEGLAIMNARNSDNELVPFDIAVRQYNKQNNLGGSLIVYKGARLVPLGSITAMETSNKFANHWKNRTRNIRLSNGEIKKINILFIIAINGDEVVY